MAKIGKFIRKTNMATRVVSIILVIAILCGSFVWFGNSDMENVTAAGTTKKYAEYIIGRMTRGLQAKFNILEIVPYEGFGEMRYYLNRKEVTDGLVAKLTALKNSGDTSWCSTTQKEWKKLEGNGFGKYNYQVRYDSINKRYEVKGDDSFLNKMFGEQAGILSNRVVLKTVEANNLTTDMINSADLIVFSTSPHDEATLKLYEAWSGNTGHKFYNSTGTVSDDYYFNTYEKVGTQYISRDMSFENLKALLDCTVKGRELDITNSQKVTLKTPVIMDYSEISGLDAHLMVYKFNIIYRSMCGAENIDNTAMVAAYDKLMEYLTANKTIELTNIKLAEILNMYSYTNIVANCFEGFYHTWLTDYFFVYKGDTLLNVAASSGGSSDRTLYFNDTANWGVVKVYYWKTDASGKNVTMTSWPGKEATKLSDGTYKVSIPNDATWLIFNGYTTSGPQTNDRKIPTDGKNYFTFNAGYTYKEGDKSENSGTWGNYSEAVNEADFSSGRGVTTRTGSSAKLSDVLQFLMGSKPEQIATYDYGHTNIEEETTQLSAPSWIYFQYSGGTTPRAYMWGGSSNNGWDSCPSMTLIESGVYGIEVPDYAEKVVFRVGDSKTGDLTIRSGKKYTGSADGSASDGKWHDYTPPTPPPAPVIKGWSKNSIKVLEVQPYNSYSYTGLSGANALGKKLLMQGAGSWDANEGNNDYRHFIRVTGVTTNALNGMTDDIMSEYDIIIIGEDITPIVKDSNGKAIYNDRTLNGYVYLAFGDLFKIHTNALGVLPDEYTVATSNTGSLVKLNSTNKRHYTEYLYAELKNKGNDKYYVLKDMEAKYKGVYFGNDGSFYTGTNSELGNIRGVDNDITDITKAKLVQFVESGKAVILSDKLYNLDVYSVYPTSDIYEFCEKLLSRDTDGNRKYGVYSFDDMSGAVNNRFTGNPKITMNKQPDPPQYKNGVINKYNATGKDIEFDFNFTGKVGSKYRIKLYVDKNSDGVYKGIEEGISDDRNELYFSRDVAYTATHADGSMNYNIKSKLSDNFIGMLSWKIEVVEIDSSKKETVYSNSVKGYSAIENTKVQKISVLQIMPKNHRLDFDGDDCTLDMGDPNSSFRKLLDAVDDKVGYEVDITVKTNEQFAGIYSGAGKSFAEGNDYLANFDMVVIGFADMFGASNIKDAQVISDISNANGAVDNIVDFIKKGKAVLFTHDTITWRVSPNNITSDGGSGTKKLWDSDVIDEFGNKHDDKVPYHDSACHNLTVALRNIVGLDKYGVSLLEDKRDGYEKPEYASVSMRPLYTSYTGSTAYVEELQGFTPWFYYRNNFCITYHSSYESGDGSNKKGIYSLRPFENSVVSNERYGFDRDGSWTTTKVEQTNEGCVTQYPYQISESLDIAKTHGQYFSLNMEDEDVVVWYTLGADGRDKSQYYGATSKDTENNYYIYSKNNITYSGAGHSDINNGPIEERKLFVNTIIKAIAGGNSSPAITITNGSVGNYGIHYVYVSEGVQPNDYQMDILARDADLVSPEAAGITGIVREDDLPGYKANGIDTDVIGKFKYANVYWVMPDGQKEHIKTYDETTKSLLNGVITDLKLSDTSLKYDTEALKKIKELVVGDGDAPPLGADFIVEVTDWLGATSTIDVKLVKRDMFKLD